MKEYKYSSQNHPSQSESVRASLNYCIDWVEIKELDILITRWIFFYVTLVALPREYGPRERERWTRGDGSCKLTI